MSGQRALRLADLPLHGRPLPLLQADLPGDGDVRLLPLTRLEVNHQSLETPEDAMEERETVSGGRFHTSRGRWSVSFELQDTTI